MAGMEYWSSHNSRGSQVSRGSLAVMRSESERNRDRLPPLVEAVPEIRQTNLASHRQLQNTRTLHEPLKGSSQFSEARSLAPSPLLNSKSRSQYTIRTPSVHKDYSPIPSHQESLYYMGQPSSNSDSSGNPEDFERRSSYVSEASVASQSTLRQDSPVLPPVPSFNGLSRGGSPERTARERQTLPSIFGNGARSSSGAYRREQLSPPRSSHDLGYSYSHTNRDSSPPLQADCMSYSNVHSRDYPYTMGQYLERSPFNSGSGNTLYPLSFDSNGDYDSKHKRRRGNLPKAVTDILRGWFADHLAHPYPTEEEKQMLMVQTGLAMSQISNWFINARRRSLPGITKQAQAEADLREKQGGPP